MTSQLRRLALSKQGLTAQSRFEKGLSGTLTAIEHLGYVQIDTISVVERAHHHVLWSRVANYDPTHLNQLLSEKQIFEYWYHAASYLPMRDYRFALPNMNAIRKGENRYYPNTNQHIMQEILARVQAEGPLRVRDFESGNAIKGGWWNKGPGRRALDKLIMQGDLMICKRKGMEKIFDLAQRCLPDNIDQSMPSLYEYANYLFDTTMRSHGIFTLKQLLHLKKGKPIRDAMQKILNERIEAKIVTAITKQNSAIAYIDTKAMQSDVKITPTLKILSPFDNVLIHRDRLSSLFNFDYRIECYVPAAKRQYGYFCLPILFGDKFVGRIDCKAHRSEQILEVISLHTETKELKQDKFNSALHKELHRFAEFNKCISVQGLD